MPKPLEKDDEGGLRELGARGNGAGGAEGTDEIEVEVGEGEEIVLEADDKDDKDDKGGKEDRRMGAGVEGQRAERREEHANETVEERRERRRQEKRESKARRNEAIHRDKTELRFLRQLVDQMATQGNEIQEIRRAQTGTHISSIDSRIGVLEGQLRQADEVIASAIESQNGQDVVKAQGIRDKIVRSLDRLQQAKSQATQSLERERQGGGRETRQQGPNPLVVAELRRFQERNQWFDPSGSDEDSAMALAIDNVLSAEGKLDPTTSQYWTELERRIKKRLPHVFEAADDDDEDDDDDDEDEDDRRSERREQPRRQQGHNGKPGPRQGGRGPRMPSGSNNGGSGRPGTFYVSADRKAAMIEAGVWDDKKLRDRYIKKYREWDEANAPRGR